MRAGATRQRDVQRLAALSVLGAAAIGLRVAQGAEARPPHPLAFVANVRSSNISVIDTDTDRVLATIYVWKHPGQLGVCRDGNTFYAALSGSPGSAEDDARGDAWIVSIDATTWKIETVTITGIGAASFAVSPDERTLFVAGAGDDRISMFELGSGRLIASAAVGKPVAAIDLSPDGKTLYAITTGRAAVTVVDTRTRNVIGSIPVSDEPSSLVVSADGAQLYVAARHDSTLSIVDTRRRRVVRTVAIPGEGLTSLAISVDGRRLYAGRDSLLSIVETGRADVVGTIPLGRGVQAVALTRDGRKLYAAHTTSDRVSVIDVVTRNVVQRVSVGRAPSNIAVAW